MDSLYLKRKERSSGQYWLMVPVGNQWVCAALQGHLHTVGAHTKSAPTMGVPTLDLPIWVLPDHPGPQADLVSWEKGLQLQ